MLTKTAEGGIEGLAEFKPVFAADGAHFQAGILQLLPAAREQFRCSLADGCPGHTCVGLEKELFHGKLQDPGAGGHMRDHAALAG